MQSVRKLTTCSNPGELPFTYMQFLGCFRELVLISFLFVHISHVCVQVHVELCTKNPATSLWVHADMWVLSPGLLVVVVSWKMQLYSCSSFVVWNLLVPLLRAPRGEVKKKRRTENLQEVFAVCFLSWVEVRGCRGVELEKLEITKLFHKFNENVCSVEPHQEAPHFSGNKNEPLEQREMFVLFFLSLCECFWLALTCRCFTNAWNLVIVQILSSCQATAGCKSTQSASLQSSLPTSGQTIINHSLWHAKQNTTTHLRSNY